jgi:uncharacterized protein (DUF1330 family)
VAATVDDADHDGAFTIAFVGYADPAWAGRAVAYEDEVLPLLADHGARLLFRGRRVDGEDPSLPLEVHVIWFPHRAAFGSYLADDRRLALVEQFGEPFTAKHVVEVEAVTPLMR